METLILKPTDENLLIADKIIKNEGLVAFPTETVYGLGALATSSKAVKSVFATKGRPSDNPLIVHVHKDYDISSLVEVDYGYVDLLRKEFLPGPLTLVYRSKGKVAPEVSCGLDSLAIRIPSDENAQKFLRAVNAPIAAPSANASKHISPVTAMHVYEDLNGRIPLILDGGRCSGGIESTVLDVTTETPLILRSGLITLDMIISVVGKCEYAQHKEGDKIKSPGVKYKHYSPRCKTKFFERNKVDEALKEYESALKQGFSPIVLCDDCVKEKIGDVRCIDIGKTSKELAKNVYAALHKAEKISDYVIGIELVGDSEIDVGVMNRFNKACRED